MYKELEETFTNDLRYRNEVVSLEQDGLDEIAEQHSSGIKFSPEEIELVWNTLGRLYKKDEEPYILMYLVYYLGFSYREAAEVVGYSAVSWCHTMVANTVKELQHEIINGKRTTESVPRQ